MRVFHSAKHKLRQAKFEINNGKLVSPFEKPERMDSILSALETRGFEATLEPSDYGLEIAQRLHRADYLEFLADAYNIWLKQGKTGDAVTYVWPSATMRQDVIPDRIEAKLGYYCLSSDTTFTKGTWEAALAAKDCAEAAVEHVSQGHPAAFALARPPGHHASSWQFGGYCFLNNAAIAAERWLASGAKRVSILDVDFHHGNGTQEIFYGRDDVQFLSIHGHPNDCFPYFLGYENERGRGKGEGYNLNYPLPVGTPYDKWKSTLEASIADIQKYKPDALVISLGVDTYEHDPISAFKLKTDDFLDYGRMLGRIGIPTVFVMEGGYAIDAIGENTVNVLEGFLSP